MEVAEAISYGYSGTRIFFIDNGVVVFIYGNSLKFLSVKTGITKNLIGAGKGISALAVNKKTMRFAYAEMGSNPMIHLHSFPDYKEIVTFSGGSTMEYEDLCFSRDGTRLASVSTLPECKVVVWNCSSNRTTPVIQLGPVPTLSLTGQFQISFNPRSSNQLCVSGYGKLIWYKLESNIENYTPGDITAIEIPLQIDDDKETKVIDHCWDSDNRIICALFDRIVKYDPLSLQITDTILQDAKISPQSLVLTKGHIVTVTTDGKILWISSQQGHAVEHTIEFGESLTHTAFSHDYSVQLVGTLTGSLLGVQLVDAIPVKSKPSKLVDFHKGDITGVDTFPFQHYAVTSGSDGTVRIWDYSKSSKTSFVVSKVQCDGPLTCVTTNRKNHLLAVGSENGVVRLLEAHNVRRPLLLHKSKIHASKVNSVKFDTKGKLLATAGQDSKVCLIDVSTTEFIVLGYVSFPGPILSLAWHMTEACQHLFVSVDHDHGDVFRIVPPEKPADSLQLKNRDVQKSLLKLNWTPLAICMDPRSSSSKKQHFFCLTSDKKLKRYSMPERTGDPDLMDDSDIAPPKEEFRGHEKIGSAIQASYDGKWIATGAKDGVVVLRPVANPTEIKLFKGHHPRVAGVTGLAFSFDSQFIVSCGGNTLFSRPLPNCSPENGEEWIPTAYTELKEALERKEETDSLTLLESKVKALEDTEDMIHKRMKRQNLEWIAKLRAMVTDIANKNANVPELERLDPSELVVDFEEKERLIEEGDKQVKELKESILMENITRDLISQRIKKECWDSMDEQGITLKGFKRKITVSNCPLPKTTEEEEKILKKIALLRKIELKEFKQRKAHARHMQMPVVNASLAGSMRELELAVASQNYKKQSKGQSQDNEDYVEDEEPNKLQDMLYHPLDLHTPQRKINQIHLLKWNIRQIKKEFNKEALAVLDVKRTEILKIEEKNERIKEIEKDLNEAVDTFHPQLEDSETPESVLTVKDDEVKAQRFLSEEEIAYTKQKQADQERLQTLKKDDSGERGLRVMMGGTLEGRISVQTFDEELIRPSHLNKPEKEMTEDEIKELREFEKKLEIISEEKEKQKKALETELKKLQGQIQEICNTFDDQLQRLLDRRIQVDQQLFEEELKIIKLSQALLQDEQNDKNEQELIRELANLKKRKANSTSKLSEFKRELEQYKESYDALVAEDKAMERTVRKDFERDYPEHFEILFKLFKKRNRVQVEATHEVPNTTTASSDPFSEFDGQKIFTDAGLDPTDKPESLDDSSWNKILELRQTKIERENEINKKKTVLNEMARYNDRMMEEDHNLTTKFDEILRQFRDFHEQRLHQSLNIDVLLKLKQGQVEVEQSAVVTDYSTSALVNSHEIEELNAIIRSLGKQKVEQLKDQKNRKKQIKKMQWANKRLDMIAEDLQEKTKYFQLLRVTKQLQELIKGGEEDLHAAEISTLEKRSHHSSKSHEQKIAEKKRLITSLTKKIHEKSQENGMLAENLAELQISVTERQKIFDIQTSKRSDDSGPANKMKRVVQIRKLKELVRSQNEELAALTSEVNKLREKAFPFITTIQTQTNEPRSRSIQSSARLQSTSRLASTK